MTFRTRFQLAFVALAVISIGGLALGVRQARDAHVRVAIASENGVEEFQRVAFLAGPEGRQRAAVVTCAMLWEMLRTS